MTLNRRDFLQLTGMIAAGLTLASCSPVYNLLASTDGSLDLEGSVVNTHYPALRRLTYGPTKVDRIQAVEMGLSGWIEAQLSPGLLENKGALWRLRPLDALRLDADALSTWEKEDVLLQLRQGALLRKIYSNRQIYEMMVEFWTDHFNIAVSKGDCWFLKVVDDREVIRKHALGNYRDLLWESAHSPAMLVYLDNQANHKEAPNENYARELMELHSLGVTGGYTQKDVMELARSLTGWTVKDHFWRGEFTFEPQDHDQGQKKVLGRAIRPEGVHEAEQVLEDLALHPATAQRLAIKLVQRFLADEPEKSYSRLIERAAQAFIRSRGEIRAMLTVVLLDGVARTESRLEPKFKRPVEYLVSSIRSLAPQCDGGASLHRFLAQMGQPLFDWPTPDGPPDHFSSWKNNLLPRWQFALELAQNKIPGTEINLHPFTNNNPETNPAKVLDQLATLLVGGPFPKLIRNEMVASASQADLELDELAAVYYAGLIASPQFQWR